MTEVYDTRTLAYVAAVQAAPASVRLEYRTLTCPECDEAPAGDGAVITDDGQAAHYMLHGAVIVGCEGFYVVEP